MAPRDALMQIFTLRQICVVKAREWANEPRKGQNEYIWVNYNELTTSSLEIIVSKGNHPQMALIQVSELL